MFYTQLFPIKNKNTNRLFTGAPPVCDLPATVYTVEGRRAVASFYKASLWQRVKFLFCGKIYVSVFSDAFPPLAVGLGELFEGGK